MPETAETIALEQTSLAEVRAEQERAAKASDDAAVEARAAQALELEKRLRRMREAA